MSFKGVEELKQNLQKVKDWTDRGLRSGLEMAANNVVSHAKSRHTFGRSLDPGTASGHPDERFYTWTSNLVNSMAAKEVKDYPNGIMVEIIAGEEYASVVEFGSKTPKEMTSLSVVEVEFGGAGRRAFPFMAPALRETAKQNLGIMAGAVKKAVGG